MARTGMNVIGNSLAAAVVDGSEKRREAEAKRGPGDVSADSVTPEPHLAHAVPKEGTP
ncbi:hypothetical protein [Streptomyces sp. NPDC056669]|uniref:hypothetical protein n=1 Tax=unclassified Streptomyces TaxID=2593676 RepID=UPI0036BAFA03